MTPLGFPLRWLKFKKIQRNHHRKRKNYDSPNGLVVLGLDLPGNLFIRARASVFLLPWVHMPPDDGIVIHMTLNTTTGPQHRLLRLLAHFRSTFRFSATVIYVTWQDQATEVGDAA